MTIGFSISFSVSWLKIENTILLLFLICAYFHNFIKNFYRLIPSDHLMREKIENFTSFIPKNSFTPIFIAL